ncbi:MAG: hypothetical protein QY318_00035 [Candidatus Dojkabacteria bacterium]|nr:MAG: hypothetical protein QY318_00035 [Candidatus Dojkabacteria bacterium]
MSKGNFEALVKFPHHNFHLSAELVGTELPFKYEGYELKICFPDFDSKTGKPKFHKPIFDEGLMWEVRQDYHDYFIQQHEVDNDEQLIDFLCNQFVVKSQREMRIDSVKKVVTKLHSWQKLFISWIEVINFIDLEEQYSRIRDQNPFDVCFLREGAEPKRVKTGINTIEIMMRESALTKADFQMALNKASSGKSPAPYFMNLMYAKKFFNEDNYRQSVIESAIACELGLAKILKIKFPGEITKISKNKLGLGSLCRKLKDKQVKDIDYGSVEKDINDKRIAVLHKGHSMSRTDAQSALTTCHSLIYNNFKADIS